MEACRDSEVTCHDLTSASREAHTVFLSLPWRSPWPETFRWDSQNFPKRSGEDGQGAESSVEAWLRTHSLFLTVTPSSYLSFTSWWLPSFKTGTVTAMICIMRWFKWLLGGEIQERAATVPWQDDPEHTLTKKKTEFKHIYYKHNFVLSWFLDAPFIILFITIALTVSSFLLRKFLICQNHWLPSWFLFTISEGKEVCSEP